jgi:hypothetical protein
MASWGASGADRVSRSLNASVPLRYEGLRCRFALGTGRVVVGWLGLAASLQTVCAAPVPRAVDQLLATAPTRRRLYGGWC